MSDSSEDERPPDDGRSGGSVAEDDDVPEEQGDVAGDQEDGPEDVEELRAAVEAKYDFENFGPADMAEMTLEEWQVAFDPETWITGEELLDRVEDDLQTRVAHREVFARVERHEEPPRIVAFSDEGYAVVYPNGSVQGEGTVLRDVKPSVALCSMESYDVPEPPKDAGLPEPETVPEQTGELGNKLLQVIGGVQLLAGLALLAMGVFAFGTSGANAVLMFAAGLAFLVIGVLLFFVVANARLSDAYRAEEYRNRLRAVGIEDGERPDFLPEAAGGSDDDRTGGEVDASGPDRAGGAEHGNRATTGEGADDAAESESP